jgi:hypothetical protein
VRAFTCGEHGKSAVFLIYIDSDIVCIEHGEFVSVSGCVCTGLYACLPSAPDSLVPTLYFQALTAFGRHKLVDLPPVKLPSA